eukprot:COSAG06_NODE_15096_length_1097_cov_2.724449_1_plen_326_part_01
MPAPVVMRGGVVVAARPGRKPGASAYTKAVRRATKQLLAGVNTETVSFVALEQRHIELVLIHGAMHETSDFARALDDDIAELRRRHEADLPATDPGSFRAEVLYMADCLRPQRKRRVGVAAGPDDDRVLGICTEETKRVMYKIRSAELRRLAAAADALWRRDAKLVLEGYSSGANSTGQAAALESLLRTVSALRGRSTATFGPQAEVCVVAVCFGLRMLGRAAAALERVHKTDMWFLGDCCVVDRDLAKYRVSTRIAYHCLRRVFPRRLDGGAQFNDNTRAREVLVKEVRAGDTGFHARWCASGRRASADGCWRVRRLRGAGRGAG